MWVVGFGMGIETSIVPVLLSEISTKENQGTITTLHQVRFLLIMSINLLFLYVFLIIYYTASGPSDYR
jgi:hypothetical protein